MTQVSLRFLSLASLGALTLGACTTTPASTPTSSLVPFTLHAPTSHAIRPQALPTTSTGTNAVHTLHVRVYTPDGVLVHFDDAHHQDPAGTHDVLTLTDTQPSMQLALLPGTYTFQSAGLGQDPTRPFLAFGRQPDQQVTPGANLTLTVKTLTDLDAVTLTPALPMNAVQPGQTFDALLTVRTPDDNGRRYAVPLSDFTADFTLDAALGSILGKSNLGARVQAAAHPAAPTFTLNAVVTAWRADGDETATITTVPASLSLPFAATSGVRVDFTPPSLTADAPDSTAGLLTLSGAASDNVGLQGLDVYDGPVLIGSTTASGTPRVTFDVDGAGHVTNAWHFTWNLPDTRAHTLTVVASDASGNEARQVVHVAATSTGGEGSGTAGALSVTPRPDAASAVSALVTSAGGGSVHVTGADGTRFDLLVPPGALAQDVQVTMTPLTGLENLPFSGGFFAGVQLEPDGLRFLRSASLTITPVGSAPSTPVSVAYHGAGRDAHLYPLSLEGAGLVFDLMHFSGYAVSSGTPQEVSAQAQRQAGGAEDAWEQALQPPTSVLRNAETPSEQRQQALQQIVEALKARYPAMLSKLTTPPASCEDGNATLMEGLSFARQLALLGLDNELPLPLTTYARGVAQTCFEEVIGPCFDAGNWEQVKAVVAIKRLLELLVGSGAADSIDSETARPCVWTGTVSYTASSGGKVGDTTVSQQLSSLTGFLDSTSELRILPDSTPQGVTSFTGSGTSTFSYSSSQSSFREEADPFCDVPDAKRTWITSLEKSLGGSMTDARLSAHLFRHPDGHYEVALNLPMGVGSGTSTLHGTYTETCNPAENYDETASSELSGGWPAFVPATKGSFAWKDDVIAGSAPFSTTDTNGLAVQGTVTWSFQRAPRP
ncbi:hypothetical protein [Deinococcus yavapaiensis]|uniref:Uncharacterized protein n=1 Tax=Deinococcus yavapaiensis KR-236 TaxID=694435 RepID=A0A318S6U5_9DEIO|nr:hypothetical protein [Deinococcus yavapaiensis]PYE52769.1 hypothetical protein DES52_11290 [Deinococcus yavapaiensis KR-236]